MKVNRWEFAGLVGAALLSALYGGYGLNDLYVYLPLAAYLRNPALYPGNPLIADLLAMPYPLYRLYALVTDSRFFFALFIITRILLVSALFAFGARLCRDRLTVWLGLALILFTPAAFGTLGGTAVLLPDPSQQALVTPWLFFALALSLAGRYCYAFALAGLAFNLHPILGAATLALLSAQLLVVEVWQTRRVAWRQAAFYLLVALALAAPALVLTLVGLGNQLVSSTAEFFEIVRFTLYFHVFPSGFLVQEYVTTALLLIYLLLGLYVARDDPSRATILAWLGVIALFCLLGAVTTEILPNAFALKLMPFRSTLFLKAIGLFYAANYLRERMARARRADYFVIAATWYGFLVNERVLLIALAVDLFLMYRARWFGKISAAVAVLLAALAVARLWFDGAWQPWLDGTIFNGRAPVGSTSAVNALLASAFVLGALVGPYVYQRVQWSRWIARAHARRVVSAALLGLGLASALLLFAAPPPFDRRIHIVSGQPADDVEEVAFWARTHTPLDARFVAPPTATFTPFTYLAERSTLGDYKQAGQAILDPIFAETIYRRLRDLGCRTPWCLDGDYETFDAAHLRALAARYDACYALTPARHVVDLVEIYRNASYRVYLVCNL